MGPCRLCVEACRTAPLRRTGHLERQQTSAPAHPTLPAADRSASAAARPVTPAPHGRHYHALAAGFSRALLVAAAATRLALITAILAIRVKRADLGEALF
jgi:hypothetical protein